MPVVEIFVRRGRTPDQIRALTDALHDALVDAYEVPRDDRFQIVSQRDAHELIFDARFMGGPRSENFVLVRVTAGRPRPVEMKRRLFTLMVDYVADRTETSPADVFIMVDNVQLRDLSLSHGRPFDLVLDER